MSESLSDYAARAIRYYLEHINGPVGIEGVANDIERAAERLGYRRVGPGECVIRKTLLAYVVSLAEEVPDAADDSIAAAKAAATDSEQGAEVEVSEEMVRAAMAAHKGKNTNNVIMRAALEAAFRARPAAPIEGDA